MKHLNYLFLIPSNRPFLVGAQDFFELAVTTFENLSSASGGCYTKLFKVLRTLSGFSYSVLESDLRLNGLIIRLFKQFLTVAE